MTAIVGVIDQRSRTLWMGGDGRSTSENGQLLPTADTDTEAEKVFTYDGCDALLIGHSGGCRKGGLIRYGVWLTDVGRLAELSDDPHALPRLLMAHVLQELRAFLVAEGAVETNRDTGTVEMDGRLLLGCQGRLFVVSNAFDCLEMSDYAAIGCGDAEALGALYAVTHGIGVREPKDRCRIALNAAAAHDVHVGPPFTFLSQRIPYPEGR